MCNDPPDRGNESARRYSFTSSIIALRSGYITMPRKKRIVDPETGHSYTVLIHDYTDPDDSFSTDPTINNNKTGEGCALGCLLSTALWGILMTILFLFLYFTRS